jgi:hypothetical protein
MSGLPEAFISHASSGRIRVKIPAKKNDADYFSGLREHFSPIPGVERVEVNPLTASILVKHTLDLNNSADLKPVADYFESRGLFKLAVPLPSSLPERRPVATAEGVAAALAGLNAQVKGWSAGMLDFSTLAVLGLISVGVLQASRGIVAVPAITAFWYASSILKDQVTNGSLQSLAKNQREKTPARLVASTDAA